MEQSLSIEPLGPPRGRILLARLLQAIGWAGIAGLALLALAMLVGRDLFAKRTELELARESLAHPVAAAAAPAPPASSTAPLTRLPHQADVPMLLARLERAARANDLPWNAADYRFVAATGTQLASLEVRSAFKAPYPKLRAMLAELLANIPGVTFRELSFARADVAAADVEAKLVIAVFLLDDGRDAAPATTRR